MEKPPMFFFLEFKYNTVAHFGPCTIQMIEHFTKKEAEVKFVEESF